MSQALVVETPTPSVRRVSRHGTLAVASFGALLAFLDVTIVNIAFPSIEQSFPTTSIGALSWVLNAYNIVFAALLVAAGRLADVFGRRRPPRCCGRGRARPSVTGSRRTASTASGSRPVANSAAMKAPTSA